MQGRTQQYRDLAALIDIPKFPQEEKSVKKYWLTVNILKIVTICALVFEIISTILDLDIKSLVGIAAVVLLIIYLWYRCKSMKKFRDILFESCDPVRALAWYGNLIFYTRRKSNWELHFYNVAILLYYSGRIEDAKKVQLLQQKYCPGNLGRMYYEMIEAKLALYMMDREKIENHCSNMYQLSKSVRLKGMMRYLYMERMQYPMLIQMRDRGEYTELYNYILHAVSVRKSLLTEVERNYYLYKVASILGDSEKMHEHRAFVIQRGGALWHRQEMEKTFMPQ